MEYESITSHQSLIKLKSIGFTLIELLVVIAIIGLLAVVVLWIIDPKENNARARDAGRITAVTQLGKSVMTYNASSEDNAYPDVSTWDADLVSTGQPASFPGGVKYVINGSYVCGTNVLPADTPTYCYDVDLTYQNAIVYSALESKRHKSKCLKEENSYFVFSTAEGSAGILCGPSDPAPWEKGTVNYVN